MTVVLYGGSFNPPTLAHVGVVQAFISSGATFDKLYMVPTYEHAYGKCLAPFEDRVTMCWRAVKAFLHCACVSHLDKIITSNPKGSMWSTYQQLRAMFPDMHVSLLVGQDQAEEMGERWYNGLELIGAVDVFVVPRADKVIDIVRYPWLCKCTFIPQLPSELRGVSSTVAREALRNNDDTSRLLQPDVADYCKQKGLYND